MGVFILFVPLSLSVSDTDVCIANKSSNKNGNEHQWFSLRAHSGPQSDSGGWQTQTLPPFKGRDAEVSDQI